MSDGANTAHKNTSGADKTNDIFIGRRSNKKLNDHGVYFFSGSVDNDNTSEAIQYILEANLDPDCNWDYITLVINSPGGLVSEGFALIDTMLGSRIPVRTVGIGQLASMGLLIFIAGEHGQRTLTPNTMILSHQFSAGDIGKEHELVAGQRRFELTSEMIMRHYKRHTGLSEKKIRKHLLPPQDMWLSAEEAKKLNLCDQIKDMKPKTLNPS